MTRRRANCLWISPVLLSCGYTIILTGGGFEKYFTHKDLYHDGLLLRSSMKDGYLYPFDPESKPKQPHIPTFYGKEREYTNIGCFQITQYVYVFRAADPAKKAFESVKKQYEIQLKAYKSRMTAYYEKKNECFCNRWKKKERRKYKVCSIQEKASRRDYELKKLSEKA